MNKNLLLVAFLIAVAAGVAVYFARGPESAPGRGGSLAAEDDDQLPMFWAAPTFEFTAHDGETTTRESLTGRVWIANFFFTQCTSICPTLTAKMVLLQRSLSSPELRFVSFSVDPDHDTPEALASYAREWSPGESRWRLLATRHGDVQSVATGFGVMVMPTDDVDDPILHSNRFFLVDPRGMVRGSYTSDDDEAMERLVADASKLIAQEFGSSPSAHAELSGPELFGAMGCAGCHNNARLGPPLAGLFGRETAFDDGSKRIADEEYVRESIVDPWSLVVEGYRATMPRYGSMLSEAQVDRLVEFLRGLRAPDVAAERPTLAVDPVCRMEITVFDDSPFETYGGVRYHFCCEHCQQQFVANPAKFVP